MSLNGLDEAAVIEAYQTALAEPGGWLLLKYVTRDTIDLLQSGVGGLGEVTSAIEQYEEKSPVYGLVQYRRRKVVLKYVPQGTSRLLQVRLTVQFQSVLEKFTPYDVVFSFTTATDMTESALSSACMPHTSIVSPASSSSSSSLQRRRLGEITEDAEEDGGERPKSASRHSTVFNADSGLKHGTNNLAAQVSSTSNLSPESQSPRCNISSIHASQFTKLPRISHPDKSPPPDSRDSPRTSVDGRNTFEEVNRDVEEPLSPRLGDPWPSQQSRSSTQSTRPSALQSDPAHSSTESTPRKPKVKLGPRPSAQRTRTPGSRSEARPIANLPNSVRIPNRLLSVARRPPSSASHRPISQQSNQSAPTSLINHADSAPRPSLPYPSIHISALYQPANSDLLSPPTSPASSLAASVDPLINTNTTPRVTPERQRLMRALELRKKQQMTIPCESKPPVPPSPIQDNCNKPEVISVCADSHLNQPKEDSNMQCKPNAMQSGSLTPQLVAASEIVTPSVSGREAALDFVSESCMMVGSVASPRIGASVDGKDAEVLSSTTESSSVTSGASRPSLKSISAVQSLSPIKPPSELQNLLHTSSSSSFLQSDSRTLLQTDPIVSSAAIAEQKEKIDTTVQLPRPQTQSAQLSAAEAGSHPLKVEVGITVNGRSGLSNVIEDLDSQCANHRLHCNGMAGPDKEISSPEASDTSDDESLYDGFQNVTVEEAKPVMVARSGVNAVSNKAIPDRQREPNRSVPGPNHVSSESLQLTPEKAGVVGKSSSSTLPQWPPAVGLAKSLLVNKPTVSSGISKRIRALEMFGVGGTSPSTAATPTTPSPTASLLKPRTFSHSPEGTLVRNLTSTGKPPVKQLSCPTPVATPSPATSTAEHRSLWLQRQESRPEVLVKGRKGDSVSVTARIIRDPADIKPNETVNYSKFASTNLHRSPLVVEHQEAQAPPGFVEPAVIPISSREPEPTVTETTRPGRRRFSLSSAHSGSGKLQQSESFTKRLSMTIRHARSESGNLTQSASDPSSIGGDKGVKGPRKNRLMKRVSALTAGSRRNIAFGFGSNATRKGDDASGASQLAASTEAHSGERSHGKSSTAESHAHVVDIGDVNIQFPDTLLWKRRFMRIDNQGFLILTPPAMEANKRGISRRFHLGDMKKPSLPAAEREELPWSIVLDFEDGSCLQCACESKYAQGQVLRLLTDARAAYRSLYMQS